MLKKCGHYLKAGELTPETELTGHYELPDDDADVDSVLEEIKAALCRRARAYRKGQRSKRAALIALGEK